MLYFGNKSGSWEGGGVAFLDHRMDESIVTLGRRFLITEEQFREINLQEGPGWYNHIIDLGLVDGVPVKTFTHSTNFHENLPCGNYLKVVEEGLKETYPELSESEIASYLDTCIKA